MYGEGDRVEGGPNRRAAFLPTSLTDVAFFLLSRRFRFLFLLVCISHLCWFFFDSINKMALLEKMVE
jgi:cell division protein FtsW (lipid II flippase)